MKVLFAASEMVPFSKTGGLADVVGALPKALNKMGIDVSVIVPLYRQTKSLNLKLEKLAVRLNVPLSNKVEEAEILYYNFQNLAVYFVAKDKYYDRDYLYSTSQGDYMDNAERFVFFARGVVEFLKNGPDNYDIVHCHDWQSALIPVYLKTIYKNEEELKNISALMTIHNLAYQGIFWHYDMNLLNLPWEFFTPKYIEFWGKVNFLKGGIVFADAITTVSKKYASEIQTVEFGNGLDGVLREKKKDLYGIVNGIDYDEWNPETDKYIPSNYSIMNTKGKEECKLALQSELGFPQDKNIPLIGMITRLTVQKGLDIFAEIAEKLIMDNVQIVILGAGEKHYEDLAGELSKKYPDKIKIKIAFDNALAHKIEAGADMFLMPSKYEPCGLNQLISMKYGTIPIVRATGGLDDTVKNFRYNTGTGNGFKFSSSSSADLLNIIKKALELYRKKRTWKKLVYNAMKEDHSWINSARQYKELYKRITAKSFK